MADSAYTVQVRISGTNQLSAPTQQATNSLRQMSTEAQRTNQVFGQMRTAMAGMFAGVSLAGVARLAEDLYQTGMNAQRAENLFRSFGAQVGDTTALLERLRVVSRGVVDDTALMESASSMLSMGLAKNADDVERLTRIGVTFAQAMGQDVASSMSNLNSLLANESLLRLDTLGISSAQVRELWNQYKAAGVESSEAFTQAFLEVAEGKLPQMSAVADATTAGIQRFQAWGQNIGNAFVEGFATSVNSIVGIVELLPDIEAYLRLGPEEYYSRRAGEQAYQERMAAEASAAAEAQRLMPQQAWWRPFSQYEINDSRRWNGPYAPVDRPGVDYTTTMLGNWSAANSQRLAGNDAFSLIVDQLVEQRASMGGWQSLGSTGVTGLETIATSMQGLVDSAHELAATDIRIASESDLAILQGMADEARSLADEAARIAGMNLSQIFGVGTGGRTGEWTDLLLGGMEIDPETQRQLDLQLGRTSQAEIFANEPETQAYFQSILDQFGPAAFLGAVNTLDTAMVQGGPNASYGLASLMPQIGYLPTGQGMGAGSSYTVQPGDTASAIAARFGVGVGDFGLSNPGLIFPGQELTWGGGGMELERISGVFGEAETSAATITDEMTTAVDTLAEGIAGVFGRTYQLPIELVISGGGGLLGQMIAAAVAGNGGTTPGAVATTGRSAGAGVQRGGLVIPP